jgi:glutathione peroxidase
MSIYDFEYTSIENQPVKMSDYKGKVLLVVNTASKCGVRLFSTFLPGNQSAA